MCSSIVCCRDRERVRRPLIAGMSAAWETPYCPKLTATPAGARKHGGEVEFRYVEHRVERASGRCRGCDRRDWTEGSAGGDAHAWTRPGEASTLVRRVPGPIPGGAP